jgi:hypothetical protein
MLLLLLCLFARDEEIRPLFFFSLSLFKEEEDEARA